MEGLDFLDSAKDVVEPTVSRAFQIPVIGASFEATPFVLAVLASLRETRFPEMRRAQ